ncbi:hypothetical protein TNCV_3053921 [Trichonephila clavipes]|nr:hypothetical protein TNCV_3053921 [Trichonephila clavipes]
MTRRILLVIYSTRHWKSNGDPLPINSHHDPRRFDGSYGQIFIDCIPNVLREDRGLLTQSGYLIPQKSPRD